MSGEMYYQQQCDLSNLQVQQNFTPYSNMNMGYMSGPSNTDNFKRVEVTDESMKDVKRESDEIIAVIVTISSGSSYDPLFTRVPQISTEGIIAVYTMNHQFTKSMFSLMKDETPISEEETSTTREFVAELLQYIEKLEAKSVVFNWECSSGFGNDGFEKTDNKLLTIQFMDFLLKKGYMVMCSDFAVKALISAWDENLLGPNPFVKTQEFSGTFSIYFDNEQIKNDCPSAQLQKVADLCEDGKATLHALGGTVGFSVDLHKTDCNEYEFQLLSIIPAHKSEFSVELKGQKGDIGHAALKYPSGGVLLVSCGHWIELVNVNASEDSVMKSAESMYGACYAQNIQTKLQSANTEAEKNTVLNFYSAQMVQNSTPAQYSKKC